MVTVGIDLAKYVFALHGIDQSGKAVLIKPKVVRGQLLAETGDRPRFRTCMPAHGKPQSIRTARTYVERVAERQYPTVNNSKN
jgi:hypothetical protein